MEPMSASTSTTLRPRNRRRTNEDDDGSRSISGVANYMDGSSSTGHSPRTRSPMPNAHPSHSRSTGQEAYRSTSSDHKLGIRGVGSLQAAPSNLTSNFLENPWASLQSFASTLMGKEGGSGRSTPSRSPTRLSQASKSNYSNRNSSTPPVQWGPLGNSDKQLGIGTREERIAQVRAKKREELLAASDQANNAGRYKRRDSDDRNNDTIENEDRDQLVYLHKVKPQDTLAGITIKYNCQANIFRKANRLWPNDSIQIRKVVVLPVDDCAIRGRKVPAASSNGTLPNSESSQDVNGDMMPTPTALTHQPPWAILNASNLPSSDRRTRASSMPTSPSISAATSNLDEPPWIHDSWVMIDGFSDAVEIARLPHRALGYFPRSRRKSVSLSDLDSPQPSFDLPRASFQTSAASPERRSNTESKSHSRSGSHLAKGLQGVGGVGTMGNNVRSPGPAQDGLNKMFAAHLPNVAPGAAAYQPHHASTSHQQHGNGGIENVGGALEGWVRKLATKAHTSLQPPTPRGRIAAGDLIELSEDVFDLGLGPDGEGNNERESDNNNIKNDIGGGAEGRRNMITGWSAQQQDQMLHERFPPRGRVFGDESSGVGKSKSK